MSVCLYLVVPCFNEEEIIRRSGEALRNKYEELMEKDYITSDSYIVFVNDGSTDNTYNVIYDMHCKDKIFSIYSVLDFCQLCL